MPRATGLGRVTDGGTSGPPGGGGASAVPDLAALDAVDDTALVDGAILGVGTMQDVYQLETPFVGIIPAGSVDYRAASSGNARWARKFVGGGSWVTKPSWFVDLDGGDDEADGNTSLTPLRTVNEFFKRLRNGSPQTNMTVAIIGSATGDGGQHYEVEFGDGSTRVITLVGLATFAATTPTVLRTSTFSAVQAYNAGANQQDKVTDATLTASWTASGLVHRTGKVTSGAATDARFAVTFDLGAKEAEVTRFYDTVAGEEQPVATDGYEMYTLPQLGGAVSFQSNGNGSITCQDLSVGTIETFGAVFIRGNPVNFVGCVVAGCFSYNIEPATHIASLFTEGCFTYGYHQSAACGYVASAAFNTLASIGPTGKVAIYIPGISRGGAGVGVAAAGAWQTSCPASIFGSAGDGMTVESGSSVVLGGALFGTGSAGVGIDVISRGGVVYTVKPTVTGALGDASIGSYPIDWTMAPFTSIDGLCGVRDANLVDDLGANYSTALSSVFNAGMMPH